MAENDSEMQPVVEKPQKKRLLGVLVTSVLIASAGVAGTILGPRLLAYRTAYAKASKSEAAAQDEKPPNPMAFQPLIVDVKDKTSQPHHMKVGLSIEMREGLKKEEFEKLQPRGRAAAIAFLRSKSFEELTDPTKFEDVTKELSDRIVKAMGPSHALKVVITDYVAQ